MNPVLLYFILLKATLTSFSGLTSLPVVRNDLVVHRHVLTDRELNAAVAAGRTAPGPNGAYIISVGYFIEGAPGACAGWLAMITPAFLIIPLVRYLGARAEKPRVKNAIRAVILAASGLLLASTVPLATASVTDGFTVAIALISVGLLIFTRIDSVWPIAGAALAGLAKAVLR
ncbi:MAG: chromate transporter [Bryobacteraceae bacterium]